MPQPRRARRSSRPLGGSHQAHSRPTLNFQWHRRRVTPHLNDLTPKNPHKHPRLKHRQYAVHLRHEREGTLLSQRQSSVECQPIPTSRRSRLSPA